MKLPTTQSGIGGLRAEPRKQGEAESGENPNREEHDRHALVAETVLEKRRDERSDHAGYGDDGDEENELDIVEAELGGENRGKHHDHRHAGAVEQRCDEEHGEIAEFGGLADRGFELAEGVGEEPVRGRAGGGGTFPESKERGNRQRKEPEAGEDEDRAPLVG